MEGHIRRRMNLLQEFLSRIRKLSKDITNKNESMF